MSEEILWWKGTVIPTGQYRIKLPSMEPGGKNFPYLQHLVKPTSGGKGRWIDVPIVYPSTTDDEY